MTLKTLKSFCADESRPALDHPITQGEFTYATNGKLILRVAKMANVPEQVEPKCAGIFDGFQTDADWQKLPALPKLRTEKCLYCYGASRAAKKNCDECDGKSRVPALEAVKIGIHNLSLIYLHQLSVLPGLKFAADKALPKNASQTYHGAPFKFNGGCGVLMPCKHPVRQ